MVKNHLHNERKLEEKIMKKIIASFISLYLSTGIASASIEIGDIVFQSLDYTRGAIVKDIQDSSTVLESINNGKISIGENVQKLIKEEKCDNEANCYERLLKTAFAHTVQIEQSNGKCLGFVIKANIIVTAAHCLKNRDVKYINFAGRYRMLFGSNVQEVVVHPNFKESGDLFDLGVIKLKKYLQVGNLNTIELATNGFELNRGDEALAFFFDENGWSAKSQFRIYPTLITNAPSENNEGLFYTRFDFREGDSGSPLFKIDVSKRKIVLLGVLRSGNMVFKDKVSAISFLFSNNYVYVNKEESKNTFTDIRIDNSWLQGILLNE